MWLIQIRCLFFIAVCLYYLNLSFSFLDLCFFRSLLKNKNSLSKLSYNVSAVAHVNFNDFKIYIYIYIFML